MDEPTAWQDINPTALAQPHAPPATCSGYLQPATREQFAAEITACLALVAPVGMTEESRREWLAVAWESLKHLPPDLLSAGCKAARETCDHPAKIVPAVIAATEGSVKYRARLDREYPPALPAPCRKSVMDRRGEAMTEADTAELNSILESLGATARYRADGSRYTIGS